MPDQRRVLRQSHHLALAEMLEVRMRGTELIHQAVHALKGPAVEVVIAEHQMHQAGELLRRQFK